MDGITWEQFLKDIEIIHDISQRLNDNWEIISANDDVAGTYLVKTNFVLLPINNEVDESNGQVESDFKEEDLLSFESPPDVEFDHNEPKNQLIKFEYHVLYHISYGVPYLCFNAYKSNGSLLTLDEAWQIFNDLNPRSTNPIQQSMLNILTQMEHPVLFKPFLTLHPCRITEILHSLPHSQNKVLSFLSVYGPTVYLKFDLEYAKHLNSMENVIGMIQFLSNKKNGLKF